MSSSPDNPKRKRIIVLASVTVGILLVFLLFRPAVIDWGMGKVSSKVGQVLTDALGVEVVIDTMEMESLSKIALKDITATPNEDARISANLGKVEVSYDLKSLFSKGGLSVTSLKRIVIEDGDMFFEIAGRDRSQFKTVQDILNDIFTAIYALEFSGEIEILNSTIGIKTSLGLFQIYVAELEAILGEDLKVNRLSCEINGTQVELSGKLIKVSDKIRAELTAELGNLDLNQLLNLELDQKQATFDKVTIETVVSDDIKIEKLEAYHTILQELSGSMILRIEDQGIFAQGELVFMHPENLEEIIPGIPEINSMPVKFDLTPETLRIEMEDVLIQGINTSSKVNVEKGEEGYLFECVLNLDSETSGRIEGKWSKEVGFKSEIMLENVSIDLLKKISLVSISDEYYDYLKDVNLDFEGVLEGYQDNIEGNAKVSLKGISVLKDENLIIELIYDDGKIKANDIQLNTILGKMGASFSYDVEGSDLKFKVAGYHVDAAKVKEILATDFGVDGYFSFASEGEYGFLGDDVFLLEVEIKDGAMNLPILEGVLDGIEGTIAFSGKDITVDSLKARTSNGQISISGAYNMENMTCNIQMVAGELKVNEAGVSGTLGFALNLLRDESRTILTGNVELKDVVIDLNALSASNSSIASHATTSFGSVLSTGFKQELPLPVWMEEIVLAVKVDAINAVRLTGNEIDVRAKPSSIELTGTLRTPSFAGNVVISGGKARLLGTDFEIIEGNIYFLGMKPQLMILAQPRLGRDAKVRVSGSVDNLSVETFGSDSGQVKFTNEQLKDEIVKLLDTRLRLYLIYDLEGVLVSKGIISDMELLKLAGGNYELQLGKEISDDVYVIYKKSLTVGVSDSVEIEYRINPNLTMTGNFMGNDDATFKLDAKFKF